MKDFDFYERRRKHNIGRIVVLLILVILVAGVVWYVDTKINNDEEKSGTDKIYSVSKDTEEKKESLTDSNISEADDVSDTKEDSESDSTKDGDSAEDEQDAEDDAQSDDEKKEQNNVKAEPGKTVPESEAVDDSYFEDAVFIGDSRVEGLMMLSGITKGTFYAEKGLSVSKIPTDKIAKVDGESMTIYDALKKQNFKKIYIKTGLNELGWVYSDIFEEDYRKVIKKIKKLQPDAIIYVQSIIHVSKEKSDTSDIYNNDKINKYNDIIKRIVEEEGVYYIDLNEEFTMEDGSLIENAASDGIHLKSDYCKKWLEYLKTHTVQNR